MPIFSVSAKIAMDIRSYDVVQGLLNISLLGTLHKALHQVHAASLLPDVELQQVEVKDLYIHSIKDGVHT